MNQNSPDPTNVRAAGKNLELLRQNSYPGRGIVIGVSDQGLAIQVYWIGGRSENSQNRVFSYESETGRVFTEAADPTKVKDPSLIIYNAMLERDGNHGNGMFAVSNGHQTDTIVAEDPTSRGFKKAMDAWQYEPDRPNFTPRISGYSEIGEGSIYSVLASLQKKEESDDCRRHLWDIFPSRGLGHCITTYAGDAPDNEPLPSFRGPPYYVPLLGGIKNIAELYWTTLNKNTRVALAVKGIDLKTKKSEVFIVNRFMKAA